MNQKERMLAGLPYKAWLDGLNENRRSAKEKLYDYNHSRPGDGEQRRQLLQALLGKIHGSVHIEPPFFCDYGYNIEIGDNFYGNHYLTILDVNRVIIGKNVMVGPNVGIYTAGHPLHPDCRLAGWEYGIGITIGDNVWIGGHAVINPGVHIGDNAVIGSGSVVTRDIPANCLAVGNPCQPVRAITEEDRKYYYKDHPFDDGAL